MGDMDSGNSGSMQSSSTGGGGGGDDQEYESRGESSFPSFFNPPNFPVNPFDNARLLQLYTLNNGSSSGSIFDHHHQQQQQQQQRQVFDSLETANFMAQNNSPSNNSHLEMVWANKFGSLRSTQSDEATCTPTTTAAVPGYNSSNPMNTPQVQLGGHVPSLHNLQGTTTGVPSAENSPRSSTQNPNQNQNQNVNLGGVGSGGSGGGPGRNPKKRSRASRRAPTTVLTTDTSNFRQMVQEFTGIPAPPFSGPGFSTRTRLDLFGGMGMGMGMSMGMGMGMGLGTGMGILPRTGGGGGTASLDPPSYLLRPFAQKVLPHPNPSPLHLQQQQRNTGTGASTGALAEAPVGASSTSATGSTAGNTIISSSTSSAANGATIPATFNLSPQHVLQPPNPMFAFQSLLQPSSNPHASDKYPLPLIQQDAGMENLGSKGAGAGSSGTAARAPGSTPGGEGEPQSWTGLHQGLGLSQGGHDRRHLTPHRTSGGSVAEGVGNLISGGTDTSNSQRGAPINGTSDNHGGVVRGERGMVDSWICSSD